MVRIKGYTYITLLCLAVSYFQYNNFLDHQRHLKHTALVQLAEINEKQFGAENYPYGEQLTQLFGPLNAKLVENHYQDFYKIETDSNFYDFYANTITLQKTLSSTLEKKEQIAIDSLADKQNFSWFAYASASLKIVQANQKLRVAIDYNLLKKIAAKSKGAADDKFFSLYEESYKDYYFPIWLKKGNDKKIYSKLGTGIHQKILAQIEEEIAADTYFEKEILKIKRMVITDLLFSKNFETSREKVLLELENILKKHPFKDKERQMISSKIQKLKQADAGFSFTNSKDKLLSSVQD